MKNPFEALRLPGVRGAVVHSGYKTTTIYSDSKASLQLYTAELLPGIWDFGYSLHLDDQHAQKFPGEGAGWFKTEDNARLFALGYIKAKRPDLPEAMMYSIDKAIDRIRNIPLFDF